MFWSEAVWHALDGSVHLQSIKIKAPGPSIHKCCCYGYNLDRSVCLSCLELEQFSDPAVPKACSIQKWFFFLCRESLPQFIARKFYLTIFCDGRKWKKHTQGLCASLCWIYSLCLFLKKKGCFIIRVLEQHKQSPFSSLTWDDPKRHRGQLCGKMNHLIV